MLSLVAGSPDMEINDDRLILAFPSEGMASEAMENLDGAITSDGDGITVARYNETKNGDEDERNSRVETPEKPKAKVPRTTHSGVKPRELFEKPAPRKAKLAVVNTRAPAHPSTLSLSENPEVMALTGRVSTLEHTSDRIEKKVRDIQGDKRHERSFANDGDQLVEF